MGDVRPKMPLRSSVLAPVISVHGYTMHVKALLYILFERLLFLREILHTYTAQESYIIVKSAFSNSGAQPTALRSAERERHATDLVEHRGAENEK